MNQDNFTQPPVPQQPITPPAPQPELEPDAQPSAAYQSQVQNAPESQPQSVPAPELEPASTPPTYVAGTPIVYPVAPVTTVAAAAVAPNAGQHKALGIWTLVTNLIYFCIPLLAVLIIITMYVMSMNSSAASGQDFMSALLVYIVLFFGIAALTLISGMAALILDIVYLVKAKPVGAKKVLTIVSLSLFGLTFVGAMLQGVLSASFS